MSNNDIQQQTTVNIQEKANLIWAIADKLVGVYKPHEYGNVILPMCVIKRFEDTLAPTKEKVLATNEKLDKDGIVVKKGFLESAAEQKFYNLSPFDFQKLLNDPENIKVNFESYLNHFSDNVIDIIHRMDFDREIEKMADNGVLYLVIKEFCTPKAYLGADQITSVDMGYIFEELVRKFSESYDEQAGAHFTARDIIYLMSELLVGDDEEKLEEEGITASIYDMAMGTSQMLGCLTERFLKIDPEAEITSYGQELNNQTFAIAKADTLIKGGNADNMRQGDTLGDDQFKGYKFDYIISNPPFGIEWKTSKKNVTDEHNLGEAGRFAPGLPAIGDGQMLFLLNGVAKLKDGEEQDDSMEEWPSSKMVVASSRVTQAAEKVKSVAICLKMTGWKPSSNSLMTSSTTPLSPPTSGSSPNRRARNARERCSSSTLASALKREERAWVINV